jgi:hypothetical protein
MSPLLPVLEKGATVSWEGPDASHLSMEKEFTTPDVGATTAEDKSIDAVCKPQPSRGTARQAAATAVDSLHSSEHQNAATAAGAAEVVAAFDGAADDGAAEARQGSAAAAYQVPKAAKSPKTPSHESAQQLKHPVAGLQSSQTLQVTRSDAWGKTRRKTRGYGAAGAADTAAAAELNPNDADTAGEVGDSGRFGSNRSLSAVHEQLSIAQTQLAAALEEKAAVQAELGTVASALLKEHQQVSRSLKGQLLRWAQPRSVCQSVSQSVNPSVSQSIHQSVNPSVSQSIRQSVSQSVSQSVHQSVSQSVSGVSLFVCLSVSGSTCLSTSNQAGRLAGRWSCGCQNMAAKTLQLFVHST